MTKSARISAITALLATTLVAPTFAVAEPAAEGLEEVVVTARKTAESVQDVPLSVTAITSEQMRQLGLTNLNDVAVRTPGLQYGNFGDLKLSPTSLRGVVGSSGSAGADPAVGMYVDEVFIGQGAGAALDLFDIDRVEVLRGPQGTLFGRNTIAGVINITTKRPTQTLEANAELDYGNFDHVRAGASISGPLGSDHLSGKIAAIYDDRGGTSDNVWLKQDANTSHHWSTRGQLLFQPSDSTELLLTGEYYEVDQSPLAFETLRYNDAATLPQVLDLFGLPRNTDPWDRKVYGDQRNEETLELWGVSALLRTRIGEVGLTNVLSYRTHDYYNRSDTDRSPASFIYDGDPENVDRFSEELRFDWTTGNLAWLAGLYFYHQDAKNLSFVEVGTDLATLLGAPELAGINAGSNADTNAQSIAGFGSVSWTLTDALDLTFGGRYTYETKEIDYSQSDPLGLLGGDFAVKADNSWSEFTPNASARYRFTPDVMGYATISKGFKSGGFNDALGDANGIGFDPEQLWNYEVGLKSELLDRRLFANVALYYMDWKDIQITNDNPATPIYDPIITNAGKAHSTGIEIELQALVTRQFRVNANLSVQEAKYDEGTLPTGEPLDKIPFAPRYTGDLNAEYRVPVGEGEISLLGEVLLRGETFLTNDNEVDGRVSDYQLYNARVAYEANDGKWSVTLWGANLGDEKVKQRLFDLSDQDVVGQKFIALNDPRTYGVTFRIKY
jgi:iron complex outermembrane receptor protein